MTVLPDGWENKPRAFSYDVMRAKMRARQLTWMAVWLSLAVSAMVEQFIAYFCSDIPWWVFIPVCTAICWLGTLIVIRLALRNCTRDILADQRAADHAKQQNARGLR